MKLQTKHFGEIDVDEDKIIEFDEGLPGFPEDKQFILLDNAKENEDEEVGPFYWLQSASDGNNAFILMDACSVMPDYNPLVDKDEISSLGDYTPDDFLIYNIVVLPENIKKMSVNLVAPVVINPTTKKGKQVITRNESYGVRHYVFE